MEIETLQKTVKNKDYTISKKKNEVNGEITNMRKTIITLRTNMKDTAQYMHPMII